MNANRVAMLEKLADLDAPSGKAVLWHEGRWESPGMGGDATPVFQADADWHSESAAAFWGPSAHWNTRIKQYVLLMNRTKNGNMRVYGLATNAAYQGNYGQPYGGYNQQYGGYNQPYAGYNQRQANFRFDCKYDRNGRITDLKVNRA